MGEYSAGSERFVAILDTHPGNAAAAVAEFAFNGILAQEGHAVPMKC